MQKLTDFQKRVYNIVREIPKGKVSSYKEIAKKLGNIYFSRAIGNALNKNRDFKRTPCYRVVKSNGEIGGYFFGRSEKTKLLRKEGIKIKNGKILDFDKVLFKF